MFATPPVADPIETRDQLKEALINFLDAAYCRDLPDEPSWTSSDRVTTVHLQPTKNGLSWMLTAYKSTPVKGVLRGFHYMPVPDSTPADFQVLYNTVISGFSALL